ncbi:ferredoxin reductase family protein [Thalassotalea agarivorans]|uniref:ferredoxin reductase family protein n=1 Tax=Thalassotalea agarivorans TaxID=349064 RepID=UPI001C42FE5C|nr:ferric reductase-like transmembrane domain-containing protein [Thalassotalea agarivorans]
MSIPLFLSIDTLAPQPFTFFSFRKVFIQFTGIVAILAMSIAILLSIRLAIAEKALGGLDKSYRLHKWMGIIALSFSVLHWLAVEGAKWLVKAGVLVKPAHHHSEEAISSVEATLKSYKHLAKDLGEWGFYLSVALIVLALVKWFPYHLFRKSHKWLAILFLPLVFHSIVLFKFDYWSTFFGWLCLLVMLLATLGCILVLFNKVGKARKVEGKIISLTAYPGVKAIQGTVLLDTGWAGHKAGQFAFVTSNQKEGAHPYTIASAWNEQEQELSFVVKTLGDWTKKLPDYLTVGMPVTIEGPYGYFDFVSPAPKQIWIAGGIGITPFIAKMKERALKPSDLPVTLFYVTKQYDQQAVEKLKEDALQGNIRLIVYDSSEKGRFTADFVTEHVEDWQQASVWFCGPALFGKQIKDALSKQSERKIEFHQELFDMR